MRSDRYFTFKAKRDYLHSTSLFDDLLAFRGELARDIDFRFAHKTARQVSYLDRRPGPDDVLVAEWNDARGRVFVVERDEPIARSEPYDEDALAAGLKVDGRTIDIPANVLPHSRIEALVAAFKRLLHLVHPDSPRRYAFVRIRLAHMPQGAVQIRYARDIGSFFQGDILEEGRSLGHIFFGSWS